MLVEEDLCCNAPFGSIAIAHSAWRVHLYDSTVKEAGGGVVS